MIKKNYCARDMFEKFGTNGVIWKKIVNNIGILDCLLSLAHTSLSSAVWITQRIL